MVEKKKATVKIIDPKKYITLRNVQYAIMAFSLLITIYLNWRIENIIFFCFFVWSILNSYPSSFYAKSSLVSIIFIPFLLLIKKESTAEHFAYFGYYLLLSAVIVAIVEDYLQSKRFKRK